MNLYGGIEKEMVRSTSSIVKKPEKTHSTVKLSLGARSKLPEATTT